MLISLGLGATPSNLTMPFTLAPVEVGGGLPAFTAFGVETQIDRVRTIAEIIFFVCMTTSPQFSFRVAGCCDFAGRALLARLRALSSGDGESFVVPTAVSGREHGAVLVGGPAADGKTHGLSGLGRELAEIQSVAKGAVGGLE
jgi:hypothetical protein